MVEVVRILDATAGHRAVWFDKSYPDTDYIDIREGLHPDNVQMDCRKTTFADGTFDLIVFDPPHMAIGPKAQMAERYGHFSTAEIRSIVEGAFPEFHRILREDGLVAFKWSDHDTSLDRILASVTGFDRLVGVPVARRTFHSAVTTWVLLRRRNGHGPQRRLE